MIASARPVMNIRRLAIALFLSSTLSMAAGAFESYTSTTFQGSALGPEQALEYGMIDHVIASRGVMPISK